MRSANVADAVCVAGGWLGRPDEGPVFHLRKLGRYSLRSQPSVLIVDRSEDAREVLCTALARRGVSTLQASGSDEVFALVQQHRPNVVVVDLEFDRASEDEFCDRFAAQSQQAPLVMLSRARGPVADTASAGRDAEFFRKPYHYGPLLRKIEELLG